MKLKEALRNKLVSFIRLDSIYEHVLSEINRLDKADINNSISINKANSKIYNNSTDIEILHSTIRNVVSVGADIVPNVITSERSWAVVCIEGNYNVVKFIDMHGADYRDILNFLKQYEGSRMVVDAPRFTYFEDAFKMK
jgi:hypothetical protein